MDQSQSFRVIGTTQIVTIPVQHVGGQNVVYWESIEQVFPGVKCVKNGDVAVPRCLQYFPGVVLDVVLTSASENAPIDSSVETLSMAATVTLNSALAIGQTDPPTDPPTDPSSGDKFIEDLRVTSALEEMTIPDIGTCRSSIGPSILPLGSPSKIETTSKTALAFTETLKRASKKAKESDGQVQQQELNVKMAYMIKLQEASDAKQVELSQLQKQALDQQEEMKQLALKHQEEMKQLQHASDAKQDEMKQLQKQALDQQEEMKQLAIDHHDEMKQMQQRVLDQVSALHARVQAVLTQTFELHEYPIPRLFVVLPDDPSAWNAIDPFSNKFRLYFLCECGDHTKLINSNTKIPYHIHLAKHEGYVVARPSEFFEHYGSYVLTILKMLKFGVTVAGVVMPAFSQLISPDGLGQTIASLKLLQDCIDPGVDHVINSMDKTAVDDGNVREEVTEQVENKEVLEGVELRRLETFLQGSDGNKVLGNLYRTVTNEGHVKWVCIDHYRENYQARTATEFRAMVESVKGSFDENTGRVKVDLHSRTQADLFYAALVKAKSVHELKIRLSWETTYGDFKSLRDSLRRTNVGVLEFDYTGTGPISDIVNRYRRYDPIVQIMGNPSIQSFTMPSVGGDFLHRSNLVAADTDFSNLKCLLIGGFYSDAFIDKFYMVHAPALKTLMLPRNSIRGNGAQALAEALKANSTLTTLDLQSNSIRDDGAKALAEALKTNKTLTTLDLQSNSIGDNGAQALAEALKTNKTLTTLDLQKNQIMYNGMLALEIVHKVISLNLSDNSISEKGFQALSEALKTISTVATLDLQSNSIGDYGAKALADALKTNSIVATLYLSCNSIGDDGAKALAEALKTNSTVANLGLYNNSIGDDGARALAEALKTNSTVATLDLYNNSIGDDGAKALAEALKTNSAVATLYLQSNSIGDDGAKALAEALKTNSTVATLDLQCNSIGPDGAKALAEALKTNSTVATLTLYNNSIGPDGAKALAEALKTNKTVLCLSH
ncbi:unnamed protein product [Mortierella alpina]